MSIKNKIITYAESKASRKRMNTPQLNDLHQDITDQTIDDWLQQSKDHKEFLFALLGFCNVDLSKCDLSKVTLDKLLQVPFDSRTIWPTPDKLPKGFDPKKILEMGHRPMMSIDKMHKMGLDGSGIVIACIDSAFYDQSHEEFKGSNIHIINATSTPIAHFHATEVLSTLCGQTVGVAPKATVIHYNNILGPQYLKFGLVQALKDILYKLQNGIHIDMVNISGPLHVKDEEPDPTVVRLVKKIESLDCKIIDSSTFAKYCTVANITPDGKVAHASWTIKDDAKFNKRVHIITGGKSVAKFGTKNVYKYLADGTYSYAIPQFTGLYALCKQYNRQITFDQFVDILKESTVTTNTTNGSAIELFSADKLINVLKKFFKPVQRS